MHDPKATTPKKRKVYKRYNLNLIEGGTMMKLDERKIKSVKPNQQKSGQTSIQIKKFNPQIIANLKPEVMWSRQNCGSRPCKGEYS